MKIPSLRAVYDVGERELEPRLRALLREPRFTEVTAAVAAARSSAAAQVDAFNARLLHAANLPAGTDVQRLRRQIGELDREVRMLRIELAEYVEEQSGGPS
jgi:hypothetical protein